MKAVTVSAYGPPSGYDIAEVERPTASEPTDVVIKVLAASVNPVDVKLAAGALKAIKTDSFPYSIGYDCAGTVIEVGNGVTKFKVGDEVWVRLPESHRGAWAEYAKAPERDFSIKPQSLSWEEAAAMPLAGMTALQALRLYNGDLTGKTVFIPSGLSGTGLYACQLAKHAFKAGKVITTVSTAKVAKVDELLGAGVVDQIIDYKKTNPKDAIPHGSVDFLFDTVGSAMDFLCLMAPKNSRIVSIAAMSSGTQLQEWDALKTPAPITVPFYVRIPLNLMDGLRRFRARRYGTEYSYMYLEANGKDLDVLRGHVDKGQLRTVIGDTADFADLDSVKRACQVVYDAKGGLGKVAIKVAN